MADPRSLARLPRVPAVDIARTAALIGMAIYHFCYDLELFGYLMPGSAVSPPLRGLAIGVAASFLALAGVSLVLAHGGGIRWRGFLRRLAVLVAGALGVSLATYVVFPTAFVYFGILHAIALFSVIGLASVRLPALGLIALSALVFWGPEVLRSEAFAHPVWHWTGLAPVPRPAVDFIPLFPWLSALLMGMALGRAGSSTGLWARLGSDAPGRLTRTLAWPGQHSLAIYLIHQPVFFALIWAFTQIA